MYAGDELYDDEVTSGPLPDETGLWCTSCDRKLTIEDGDGGLCRDCQRELGGSD